MCRLFIQNCKITLLQSCTVITRQLSEFVMSPSLQGKVCLVTGAARGIGRGIALQLGQAGATVYITGRTAANLEECARDIKAH